LGGQVRNPHMLDRSPCGSSSGSAVAVAASLAPAAVGTETNGSIICPANVNGITGFKPTVGLVSQQYIIPISATQDTAGPLTKTITGAAMLLTAMATPINKQDYVKALNKNSLAGARVGVLRFAEGSNPDIRTLFNESLEVLADAGATLVEIADYEKPDGKFFDASYAMLLYEFKAGLNDYLRQTSGTVHAGTLQELIEFNAANPETELTLFDQSIFEEAQVKGPLTETAYQEARKKILKGTRENGIDAFLTEHNLDILVSPSGPVASPRWQAIHTPLYPWGKYMAYR